MMIKAGDAVAGAADEVDPRELPPTRPFGEVTWYALATDSHRQKAAVQVLRRRGIETVAPLVRVKRRSWTSGRRCRTLIKQPLLPDYVMAGFAADPAWLDILSLHLVRGVVGMDGVPLVVPAAQVELFASRHGMVHRPGQTVRAGCRAQLLDGPFLHHWAVVERIDGDIAHVLLELFGRPVRTSCELDILEAA